MTVTPERAAGCPDLETLAVFVEGRLDSVAREEIVRHLADCDACREVVAESRSLVNDLDHEQSDAGVLVSFPEPNKRSSLLSSALAVAAALALMAGAWWFASLGSRESRVVADLASSEGIASLPSNWADPVWPVMRSGSSRSASETASFRAGVRAVDLRFALEADSGATSARLAGEFAQILGTVPFSAESAAEFREIAAELGRNGTIEDKVSEAAVRAIDRGAELLDPEWFALGRWAEVGRLLGLKGDSRAWTRPPSVRSESPEFDSAIHRAHTASPNERADAFARLIALAGRDQQQN